VRAGLRALWLTAVLVTGGCRERVAVGPEPTPPSQVVESLELHECHSGLRLYSLRAERADVFDGEQRVEVEKPEVTFYDGTGKAQSWLAADSATIHSQTEDLVARGHVVVRTADSTVLSTDSLCWSNSRRVVSTDAPVEISTPKGVVRGQGLRSDAGLDRIQILSEVRGSSDYKFEAER
jgi:LPS export ABC transporter protein LptC